MLNKSSKKLKCRILDLIIVFAACFILLTISWGPITQADNTQENSNSDSNANIIVPGVRVGEYKLGMSKDEVLKILRKTKGDSLREAENSISVDGVMGYPAKKSRPAYRAPSTHASLP